MKNKKISQNFEKYATTHEMKDVADFLKDLLQKNINFKKNIKILDYGCGDGGLLSYFSKFVNKKNIYGAEVSKIRVKRVKKLGFSCDYIDQNNIKLKFKDNTFDVITMIEVIEHIPKSNIESILKEIKRVLKAGGKLILTTPNYPIKRVYDCLMIIKGKNIIKTIKDDPTHVSRYNFRRLYNLLIKQFQEVRLSSTHFLMESKFKFMKKLRKINFFSHKIFGVCKK